MFYECVEVTQYHFAFTIPSNQFKKVKQWVQTKIGLLQEDGEDEVYFERSHAHSVYFLDPCENIVELIAHHGVSPSSHIIPFSSNMTLNISEMNLTTDDVLAVCESLLGMPVRHNHQVDIIC